MHFIAGMSRWGGIICSLLASLSLHAQQASLAEAKAQIDQFWAKKVAPCGNTLATRYVAGDFNVMKGGRWTVQPGPISQVDAMNGIQWQGSTQLIAEASRVWLPNQGWQSWEQGTGGGAFGVDVTKANGRWTFRPNFGSAIDDMIAPACSAVPREPTATERASALNAQMQGLCEIAKPGPRYSIGAVGIWVQQANDVNSCRDEQGRTLLMLHFLNSVYNSAGNQITLIRSGANLSVKDNRGWSALRYAVQAYHSAQARDLREVMGSYRDRIREMVARGADPENMVDAQGNVLDQPIPNASGTQSTGDQCAAYERLKAEGKLTEESTPPKGCPK